MVVGLADVVLVVVLSLAEALVVLVVLLAEKYDILPYTLSKLKMKGKELSRFQFYFPGLPGTFPMSKQELIFFYSWTLEIIPFIHFGKQMDKT